MRSRYVSGSEWNCGTTPGNLSRQVPSNRHSTVEAMAQKADTLDLSRFVPAPGDGRRVDVDVAPGRLVYGGQPYEIEGGTTPVRLDLSRTTSGYALRLRFDAALAGPCVRCLEPASQAVS